MVLIINLPNKIYPESGGAYEEHILMNNKIPFIKFLLNPEKKALLRNIHNAVMLP